MDVNCMTEGEINGLIGKEVYYVRRFDIFKKKVHYVVWFEDIILLGFDKSDPYSHNNSNIENACLTKDVLLKELPNFVAEQKKEFEDDYTEAVSDAEDVLKRNLKWLKESEQNFLKQLENM